MSRKRSKEPQEELIKKNFPCTQVTTMLKAFHVTTLVWIAIAVGRSSGDSIDSEFVSRSVNLCVTKTFMESFVRYALPTSSDAADGQKLYNGMKRSDTTENGKAGMIFDVAVDRLLGILKKWRTSEVIPSKEIEAMSDILAERSFKTIREHIDVRDNGDVVYGIIGVVETSTSSERVRKGSVVYAFRKFALKTPARVTYERDSGECKLWQQFCVTKFSVSGMNDNDSQRMFNYMRFRAVNQFVEESRAYLDYAEREFERYKRFLPSALNDVLKKIEKNPNKSLTELFNEDPFISSKY